MLLPPELLLAAAERFGQLLLLGDVEEEAVEIGGPTRLIADDRRLVVVPMHRPIAADHAVLRPERRVAVPPACVLGQHPLAVPGVENLGIKIFVGDPLLHGVTELGLKLWTGVYVGRGLVQPVDIDGDRDVFDERPECRLI